MKFFIYSILFISHHLFANDIDESPIKFKIEHVQSEDETKGFNIIFQNLSKSTIVVTHLLEYKLWLLGFAHLKQNDGDPPNSLYTYRPTRSDFRKYNKAETVWMKVPPKESYKIFVPISHFLKRNYNSFKGTFAVVLLGAQYGMYNSDLNKVQLKKIKKKQIFSVNIIKKGVQNISSKKVIKLDSKKYDEKRKQVK